jgi:hypothetical protein
MAKAKTRGAVDNFLDNRDASPEDLEDIRLAVERSIRKGKVLQLVQKDFPSNINSTSDYVALAIMCLEVAKQNAGDLPYMDKEQRMLVGSLNSVAGSAIHQINQINPEVHLLRVEGGVYGTAGRFTRDVSRMFSAGSYLSASNAYRSAIEMGAVELAPHLDHAIGRGLDAANESMRIMANAVKMKQTLAEDHPSRQKAEAQLRQAQHMIFSLESLILE